MPWLLDTNTCIYIIKQKPVSVFEKAPLETKEDANAIRTKAYFRIILLLSTYCISKTTVELRENADSIG